MICVYLASGFEEVEALTVVDILRRAGKETASVSVTGEKMVAGSHGITVEADYLFEEIDHENCQMIVLPGGLPGAYGLRDHRGLASWIEKFSQQDRPLAAICAAPLVFGNLGILTGKKAVIYPGMEEFLGGAIPADQAVVRDGNLITAKGPAFAMEFALAIVELLCGAETAKQLRRDLLLDR